MKVLLDHCVPKQFARLLVAHDVKTTAHMRWNELGNGKLLDAAREGGFQAIVTADANMQYQQSDSRIRGLMLVVMLARSNRIQQLGLLAPQVLRALADATPGSVVTIDGR